MNRRNFISNTLVSSLAAAALPLSSCQSQSKTPCSKTDLKSKYETLDKILKQPVLKDELFTYPVIIESVELLRNKNNFLCISKEFVCKK